ncbi:MAG: type II toxin-antitoxin system RelE/ParE family toxin [Candidatus Omnitrophica bacterium]|nr:type II toxin-antitoxin system RelE/ParE family toxin [Candidatus Omnitrophota bacterium]
MNIIFSNRSFRQLSSLEKEIQKRIKDKLDFFISQENPLIFAEKIKDSRFGEWRYRIGEYRVIFDLEDINIIILKVGHRRDVYK